MKKILIGLIVLVTAAMVGFAKYVKASNIPVLSLNEVKERNCKLAYEYGDFSELYFYSDSMNYMALSENSDLIVEVTCLDQGSQRALSVLRKCSISKVIEGNYEGDCLYLYEPSFVSPYNYINVMNGYLNMQEGQTYIVFLKKVNAPDNANEEFSKGYHLTSAMYGKYRIGCYESLIEYQEGDDIYYDQVANHETMLVSQKQVDIYNEILKKIEEVYNN